ncbi:MAG: hypothetical protein WC141_10340 [Arcobacteraceae bacterium]
MSDGINVKKNIFDNTYVLFFLFVAVVVINLIASIYFLNILLLGIVFSAYTQCLKTQNYYPMIYVILAILFIELNNGFKPFSILLLGSFIYVYLIPFLTRVMVIDSVSDLLQIVLLYIGVLIIWSITNDTNFTLIKILFLNLILDIIIIGLAP